MTSVIRKIGLARVVMGLEEHNIPLAAGGSGCGDCQSATWHRSPLQVESEASRVMQAILSDRS